MSKIYDLYQKLKEQEKNKIYLFKVGSFYLTLGDDAILMNKELGLKLTRFSNESNKCGFPLTELEKYQKFIKLLGLEYEIILNEVDTIINDIQKIDINILSSSSALDKIKCYHKLLNSIE